MRKKTVGLLAATLVCAAALGTPSAAQAAGTLTQHGGYATKTSCVAASSSPAYNNSYVRVAKACYNIGGGAGWAFYTRTAA